jgi:hypothetical protein
MQCLAMTRTSFPVRYHCGHDSSSELCDGCYAAARQLLISKARGLLICGMQSRILLLEGALLRYHFLAAPPHDPAFRQRRLLALYDATSLSLVLGSMSTMECPKRSRREQALQSVGRHVRHQPRALCTRRQVMDPDDGLAPLPFMPLFSSLRWRVFCRARGLPRVPTLPFLGGHERDSSYSSP